MKRLLLLSLISLRLFAGIVEDLETAIIASDLHAVEQLLACRPTIDQKEKYAFIELATDILREREDIRNICAIRGWANCYDVRTRLSTMLKERNVYGKRSAILFFLSWAGASIVIPTTMTPTTTDLSTGLCVTYCTSCFLAVIYYFYQFIKKDLECERACTTLCDELWNNAIKIRQLLYKI